MKRVDLLVFLIAIGTLLSCGSDSGNGSALSLSAQVGKIAPNMAGSLTQRLFPGGLPVLPRGTINPTFSSNNSTVQTYVAPFFKFYCHFAGTDDDANCAKYGKTASSDNEGAPTVPALMNGLIYVTKELETAVSTSCNTQSPPTIGAGTISDGSSIILDDADNHFKNLLTCVPTDKSKAYASANNTYALLVNNSTSNGLAMIQAFATVDSSKAIDDNGKLIALNYSINMPAMAGSSDSRVQGVRIIVIGNLETHRFVGKVVNNGNQQPAMNIIGVGGYDSTGTGNPGHFMVALMAEGGYTDNNGYKPQYYCVDNANGNIIQAGTTDTCVSAEADKWIEDGSMTKAELFAYLDVAGSDADALSGFGDELVRWSTSVTFAGLGSGDGYSCEAATAGNTYGICTFTGEHRHFSRRDGSIAQSTTDTFFTLQ